MQTESTLKLPLVTGPLGESSLALNCGIVALALVFDNNCQVLRDRAIQKLVDELELADYVKHTNLYSYSSRAATSIIRGMAHKSWVARWNCPMRKDNRSRATTKGYFLTNLGKEKIKQLKSEMHPSVLLKVEENERKWNGKPVIDEFADTEQGVKITITQDELLKVLAVNAKQVEPLISKLETINKNLNDAKYEIDILRKKIQECEKEIKVYDEIILHDRHVKKEIEVKLKTLLSKPDARQSL